MNDSSEYPTSRTRPAQAPLATAAPLAGVPTPPSTAVPAAAVDAAVLRAAASAAPAMAVTFADPATVTTPQPAIQARGETSSDEERALLSVLRLLDRNHALGVLTPVERAFIEGARIMFDHLAKACKEILDRDLGSPSKPKSKPSESATSSRPATGRDSTKGPRNSSPS